MKVLLGLTIILGGVLISKNSYAVDNSIVTGSPNLHVSGPVIDPSVHAGNKPACPLLAAQAQKNGTFKGGTSVYGAQTTGK